MPQDGTVIASLPIGDGSDFATFDPVRGPGLQLQPRRHLVHRHRTEGQVCHLAAGHHMRGARTMALDPKSGRLYLVASDTTVNDAVPATDRAHYRTVPGSAKLLVLGPAH